MLLELPHLLNPQLTPQESKWFQYKEGRCSYIRKQLGEALRADIRVLESTEDKTRWLDETREELKDKQPGIYILLLECITTEDGQPSPPWHLPLSMEQFAQVQSLFHVHSNIARSLSRGNADITRVRHCESVSFTYHMGPASDMAAAVTYFHSTQTTFAVVFGVKDDARKEITRRLRLCAGPVEPHPLLVPGMLAETEKKSTDNMVEDLVDEFEQTAERVKDMIKVEEGGALSGDEICSWIEMYMKAREHIKHLKASEKQLERLIGYHDEIEDELRRKSSTRRGGEGDDGDENDDNDGGKATDETPLDLESGIGERLQLIQWDYDAKIAKCEMIMSDLVFLYQVSMAHLARQESKMNTRIAERAGRDSAQMKSLAILGAIYLPMTSVASIFSMEVFDWQANRASDVVSRYFYVYIGIAVALTICTLLAGWRFMKSSEISGKSEGQNEAPKVYGGDDYC